MAYRAGARLSNLEFVQFHPTCLFHPDAKNFLISEAVRGEGAVLRNLAGEAFMQRYDPQADLAPRDIVARAIDSEMKRRGEDHVLLDTTVIPADHLRSRFPNIASTCARFGLDMASQPLPVVPAAHYQCGGVVTNQHGESDLPGLFVIGEAACTGLHGANRLASNSLLEALYYAEAASNRVLSALRSGEYPQVEGVLVPAIGGTAVQRTVVRHDWNVARRTMWDYVGIVRDGERLAIALERMEHMQQDAEHWSRHAQPDADLYELRNVTLVGALVIRSALFRQESRGLHARPEFPATDDLRFCGDTLLSPGGVTRLAPHPQGGGHAIGERV
jgi:L-aspartate oxidase